MHRKANRDRIITLKPSWHQLDEIVAEIMLDKNPLGWDVQSEPICFRDGALIETTDAKEDFASGVCENAKPEFYVQHFWRATDDGLPVGNRSFNPSSYADSINVARWIEFIRKSLAGTNSPVQTIGSVRNRGRLFCTVALDTGALKLSGGHEMLDRLTFIRSLDMSCKWYVVQCKHDTVCDNTLELTTVFDSPFKCVMKMTKSAPEKIENMVELIDDAFGVAKLFNIAMTEASETPLETHDAKALFAGFEATTFKRDKQTKILVPDKTDGRLTTTAYNRAESNVALFNGRGIGCVEKTVATAIHVMTQVHSRLTGDMQQTPEAKRRKLFESSEHGAGNGSARQTKADFVACALNRDTRNTVIERGAKLIREFEAADAPVNN